MKVLFVFHIPRVQFVNKIAVVMFLVFTKHQIFLHEKCILMLYFIPLNIFIMYFASNILSD